MKELSSDEINAVSGGVTLLAADLGADPFSEGLRSITLTGLGVISAIVIACAIGYFVAEQ